MGPEHRLPTPPQECLAEPQILARAPGTDSRWRALETVPLVRLKADPLEGFFPHLPSLVPPKHPLPRPLPPTPSTALGQGDSGCLLQQ